MPGRILEESTFQHRQVPGPVSKTTVEELNPVWDSRAVYFVVDYAKSHDSFLVDVDGNEFLDVYSQIASIPVGYNNARLIETAKSPEMVNALVNRPAVGNFPAQGWLAQLKDGLLRVAPKGHNKVFTAQSGSEANELAYKAAFMRYMRRQRGEGVEWSQQEIESCMNNSAPGSPDLAILSFKNSFHGRGFGSLSTTRSKAVHKLDIPAFNWPQAPFPALKYPLEENVEANKAEEEACLKKVEELIASWHCPVAAVIVEPIQSEGGDNHASPAFFQGLRDITKRHDIMLIADEVQTGFGATGRFWAHEHWQLSSPPDMVTFSKKAQTAGYFFGDDSLTPDKAYRQFNTWIGDPARVLMCNAVISEIIDRNLVEQTAKVGEKLYTELAELAKRFPDDIQNLRGKGQGTYIAFDTRNAATLVGAMRSLGVNIGTCGVRTVRLRPMLIFEEDQIPRLVQTLERALK
ncbi:4-aminobutyrate transaminase [Exophiala oligosperma]